MKKHSSAPYKHTLFLDRDGTLIEERHYLSDPTKVNLFPDTVAALAQLKTSHNFIIITNQSGIGRGLMTESQFQDVQDELLRQLESNQITILDTFYCPHRPEDNCECRKPKPGLIQQAISQYQLDTATSVLIGDKVADVAAGKAAGVSSVLVKTGYGQTAAEDPSLKADYIANNLMDAVANFILKT